MNDMMLMALTDPAGAPAHPLIFLVLGVVTFALHLTAVNVMLGTLGLAAWGAFSKNPYWQRLAGALGTTAKVAVSVAIVLGVAPLLFVHLERDLGLVAPRLPRHPYGRLPRPLPLLRSQPPL